MSNPLVEKSYKFSYSISKKALNHNNYYKYKVVLNQLFRSSTSIASNIAEAQGAQTRKDFLLKMSISYKEALESNYWIKLATDLGIFTKKELKEEQLVLHELILMLGKTKVTTRKNIKRKP